jgi:uncharacterized sulfatase
MPKILDRFHPYLILGSVYLTANILLRSIDFFLLAPLFNAPVSFPVFFRCLLNDLIWCGCVFLACLPVFLLLNRRFPKASVIVPSVIFGTLFLLQIVLVVYAFFSGKPLDKEIFMRPFSEIYTTVNSYGNILLFPVAGIVLVWLFSWITTRLARKSSKSLRIIALSFGTILLLSVFMISYPYRLYGRNTQNNRFIINRALYFIYEDIHYNLSQNLKVDPDPVKLKQFAEEYPEWHTADTLFPYMRYDTAPDRLSPFFSLQEEKPDIVIIICESLGRGISGKDAWSGSFTPFLDSLANHSLYWENCVSTAMRSFGILPALLGSLPNGNTGFQFGNMPAHESLVSLLKLNGYATNMFYAGYYEFDNVKTFMGRQGIDYFAPYYEEYKASGFSEEDANEWGYADGLMFRKSLEWLSSEGTSPRLDIYVTLSAHNDLDIPGNEKYVDAARIINSSLDQTSRRNNNLLLGFLSSFVYTDDALRQFFKQYRNLPGYENTIFIITGDHYIPNFGIPSRLSLYHVPLIIWSPLIKEARKFESLVSVTDVTPSLWSMLSAGFDLNKSGYVSWITDGLDTAVNFRSTKKLLLMQDNRDLREFIYSNYFFSYDSVYTITDKLRLEPASSDITEFVSGKYRLFSSVGNYVYNMNRLMPVAIDSIKQQREQP